MNQTLANNITAFMRGRPEEAEVKELFDSFLAPSNCPDLEKAIVKEDIWSRLTPEARSGGIKLQRVQTALEKGVSAVATMCHLLPANFDPDAEISAGQFQEVLNNGMKAFKAIGTTNFKLATRRRESLHSSIASDNMHLCAPFVPFTVKLFADDVTKMILDISNSNRLYKNAF